MFRFHDLRHRAITQLAENGTSDSTIMAIVSHVSHVSRRMLERYRHVRMEANRTAVEALALSTKTAGYGTSRDTSAAAKSTRPF
jgi:integrase